MENQYIVILRWIQYFIQKEKKNDGPNIEKTIAVVEQWKVCHCLTINRG